MRRERERETREREEEEQEERSKFFPLFCSSFLSLFNPDLAPPPPLLSFSLCERLFHDRRLSLISVHDRRLDPIKPEIEFLRTSDPKKAKNLFEKRWCAFC